MGVYVFSAFVAALGLGAFLIRLNAQTKVLITVAFLLSVVGALTAMGLSSTPFHWEAPAFGGVVLAIVYTVWRVYRFLTPVWMIWKLNEGIEPFGPSSAVRS